MSAPDAGLSAPERLAAIGRAAGEVAHDVRNLLGVILATAEAAADRPGTDPAIREDLRLLRDAAQRAASLLGQLLAGTQPEARPFRLGESLARLAPLLRRALGEGIALVLPDIATRPASHAPAPPDPDPSDGFVLADPAALDRVWLNLAANAGQAMGGSGTLSFTLSRVTRAPPGAAAVGCFLCVAVVDTGPGVPPAVVARLGQPLVTSRAAHGGTGLGLASVTAILAGIGGFLEVANPPGGGARLLVFLPEHCSPAEEPSPAVLPYTPEQFPPERPLAPLPSTTVLLVEDEPVLARLAARTLVRDGWRVIAEGSAEAALARLETLPDGGCGEDAPAVLVTDLTLPGLDGLALLTALRRRAPALPAIITSGYVDAGQVLPPRTAFLAKPYPARTLLALVREMAGSPPRPRLDTPPA